jgi:hypothetical protein
MDVDEDVTAVSRDTCPPYHMHSVQVTVAPFWRPASVIATLRERCCCSPVRSWQAIHSSRGGDDFEESGTGRHGVHSYLNRNSGPLHAKGREVRDVRGLLVESEAVHNASPA